MDHVTRATPLSGMVGRPKTNACYEMTATAVTLNDLEGHSQVAGLFKCNPSNICTAFYTISTDRVLARFLCISRASCDFKTCIMYGPGQAGMHLRPTHRLL